MILAVCRGMVGNLDEASAVPAAARARRGGRVVAAALHILTPRPADPAVEHGLRRLWIGALALALAAWAGLLFNGFHASSGRAVVAFAALPLIGLYVRWFRKRTGLQDAPLLIETVLLFLYLGLNVTLASFAAAALAQPLYDATFAAIDRSIGYDWFAVAGAVQQWPWLRKALQYSYGSFVFQPVAALIVLALIGKLRRAQVFVAAWLFAAVACVALSALLPAQSPYGHWTLEPLRDYPISGAVPRALTVFLDVRAGRLRDLFAFEFEGIVTFPSFHALCGVLFAWAFWAVPYLRWPMVLLNGSMIASTPMVGSHYLIDVLVGLALAPAALWVGARIVGHRAPDFISV
jgi:hypothetical protein